MYKTQSRNVTILCSGFGLGFYIPGLLTRESLSRQGIEVDVEVFESLLAPEKIEMVEKNRQAYHDSFRVAIASQKVPVDSRESLEPETVASLIGRWEREDRRQFICLSGHWVHVLDLYRASKPGRPIASDLLYLDADLAPSWRQLRRFKPGYANGHREVRLYDPETLDVLRFIDTNVGPPIPYGERERRLVVHGGGWGIGTFQKRIPDMESAGFDLDVVCYSTSEASEGPGGRRYFMDDPTWRTWHRDQAGNHTFPPFGEIRRDGPVAFTPQTVCNGLHRKIRGALAIVSKPGAGTLIDSFNAATPLVLLEPFGPHEERNAQVWLTSGFGVPYSVWADEGYSTSLLEELHRNLLAKRQGVKDYAREFAETVLASA